MVQLRGDGGFIHLGADEHHLLPVLPAHKEGFRRGSQIRLDHLTIDFGGRLSQLLGAPEEIVSSELNTETIFIIELNMLKAVSLLVQVR